MFRIKSLQITFFITNDLPKNNVKYVLYQQNDANAGVTFV